MEGRTVVDPRSYDQLHSLAALLREKAGIEEDPEIAIITGSGLGHLADEIEEPKVVPFEDLPGLSLPTVEGHSGRFVFGVLSGRRVVVQQGRIHSYEHKTDLALCAVPARLMALLGCKFLIATNAVGAVNKEYRTGEFMVYKDHLCIPLLAGLSPLSGTVDPRFGDRFVPAAGLYDRKMREHLLSLIPSLSSLTLHEGVYAMAAGPQFETVTELNFLRALGCDVVGMSVAHEALVSFQMGMRILAFCLVTNDLVDTSKCGENLSNDHVIEAAAAASQNALSLLKAAIDSCV